MVSKHTLIQGEGGKLVLPSSTFQSGEDDCPQLLFPWSGISEVRTADSYGASEAKLIYPPLLG
jgi:hypothetical protein